jgi:hypothetical protein
MSGCRDVMSYSIMCWSLPLGIDSRVCDFYSSAGLLQVVVHMCAASGYSSILG